MVPQGLPLPHLGPLAWRPIPAAAAQLSPSATAAPRTGAPRAANPSTAGPAVVLVPILHADPRPLPLGDLTLDPDHDKKLLTKDRRLEVEVPAGAVRHADLAAGGGALHLRISQIAPASGSNAGGSGRVSLGAFQLQVVDASGQLASQGLRRPARLSLHYGSRDAAVDLAHAYVMVDGTASLSLAFDPTQRTLSATVATTSSTTTASFNTNAPVASFGKPDPFNVDLNAGSLTASYPLDVPAGPGGLTPPLSLAYGSAGVAEQHNPQAAAGWVGEGWNLSLGSVSWAQHNVPAKSGGSNWQDTWLPHDPYGP